MWFHSPPISPGFHSRKRAADWPRRSGFQMDGERIFSLPADIHALDATPRRAAAANADEWTPLLPVPADAQPPLTSTLTRGDAANVTLTPAAAPNVTLREGTRLHAYRDTHGRLLGYVQRIEER